VHAAAFSQPGTEDEPPEAILVDTLRDGGFLAVELSLLAVLNGEVVGHVACSHGQLGRDRRPVLGLAPLGVLPAHQRSGIGTALMHAVLGAADALGEPAVVVLGEPGYYGRFGFERAALHGVLAPDRSWGSAFQIRRLTTWSTALTGSYSYAPPFDAL
jgi:putative acetyltransferase